MGSCDWCSKSTNELKEYSSLGNISNICNECYDKAIGGICRVCGESLGHVSHKGMCLICTQLDYSEASKQQTEESAGVDYESLQKYSSPSEFTESDYNHWMTFGQGNFTPQKRAETRAKWLVRRLGNEPGWNNMLIAKHINSLFKLMDTSFDMMSNRAKYKVVCMDSGMVRGNIVAAEGYVGIVEI